MTYAYTYGLTDFPNDTVDETRLKAEVEADPAIATELLSIGAWIPDPVEEPGAPATCVVVFAAELASAEKTALDALVAAHSAAPVTCPIFRASSTLVELEKEIVAVGGFEVLAGVVTTPDFFSKNLAALVSRIVGEYRAVGTGAELRVVEDDGTVLGTFSLVPAADWTKMQWYTSTAPSAGTHHYTLEGRLNTATSAKVRFVSMSLLEMCV
jgi:hypothetical protein